MNFAEAAYFTDFAIDITVNGLPARGIFDNGFASAFGGMVDGTSPVLHLISTLPVERGNPVIIAGKNYTVVGVEPDGTGVTQLRLDKA